MGQNRLEPGPSTGAPSMPPETGLKQVYVFLYESRLQKVQRHLPGNGIETLLATLRNKGLLPGATAPSWKRDLYLNPPLSPFHKGGGEFPPLEKGARGIYLLRSGFQEKAIETSACPKENVLLEVFMILLFFDRLLSPRFA